MKASPLAVVLLSTGLAVAACSSAPRGRDRIVSTPQRCQDQTVQIYFEGESAEVTRESGAVIRQAAATAAGCLVKSVSVLGLADAAGEPGANMELSKRRAQSVTAALASAGLPEAEFRVSAAGQTGAITADGRTAPLRRRADVVLHLTAR